MLSSSVVTNIGVINIHTYRQQPILGTNMFFSRPVVIVETSDKRYAAFLNETKYDVPNICLEIAQKKNSKSTQYELLNPYSNTEISKIQQINMLYQPSKRIPSTVTHNNQNGLSTLVIDFLYGLHDICYDPNQPPKSHNLDIESYKKTLYKFQFTVYEYDSYNPNTKLTNQKLTNILKLLLRIEQGADMQEIKKEIDSEQQNKEWHIIDDLDELFINLKNKYDAINKNTI